MKCKEHFQSHITYHLFLSQKCTTYIRVIRRIVIDKLIKILDKENEQHYMNNIFSASPFRPLRGADGKGQKHQYSQY